MKLVALQSIVTYDLQRIKDSQWLPQKKAGGYGKVKIRRDIEREEKVRKEKWTVKDEKRVDWKERKIAIRN